MARGKFTGAVLTAAVGLLLSGCESPPEPGPAEVDNFKSYYARLMVLRELSVLVPYDSLTVTARSESLRSAYGLTDSAVRGMEEFLQDSLPRWETFLSDVRDTIELRRRDLLPDGTP